MHSEIILTPSLFSHFVMLQPYAKFIKLFIFYTRYLIMTKQKPNFINFCTFITKWKTRISNWYKYSDPLTLKFSSGASHYSWSTLKCFYTLSPAVVNSIDWKWFWKSQTCLYNISQLTIPIRAKTKPWGRRNCLQSSETGWCWGTDLRKAKKKSAALKVPKSTVAS